MKALPAALQPRQVVETRPFFVLAAKSWRILGFAICLLVFPLQAQVVNDGATNILSNVTNTIGGDVIIGTNGAFTLLILANNTLLTNSVRGLIGRNASARSNEVRLLSPGARWQMGNNLFVGSNGALSRLVISNGARVVNFDGVLANATPSSNNLALAIHENLSAVINNRFPK